MEWEALSGIGYIDPEKAVIIKENGEQLSLYSCKFILILNNLAINYKNEEGKCLYIPIDKKDIGFKNDDRFTHVEYLKHVLPQYTFGDGNNEIHDFLQKIKDGEEQLDYDEWFIPLTKMGICVFSNICYSLNEPYLKQGGLYVPTNPKQILDSQIEQVKNLIPALRKERFFRTGLWTVEKKENTTTPNLIKKCMPDELADELEIYCGKKPQGDDVITKIEQEYR